MSDFIVNSIRRAWKVLLAGLLGLVCRGDERAVSTVTRISDLVTRQATNVDLVTFVTGYYSVSDGGEGLFQLVRGDTSQTNRGTRFQSAIPNFQWQRVFSGPINVKWFGAKGDGLSDDTLAVKDACQTLVQRGGGTVYFPASPRPYLLNLLVTNSNVHLAGDGYSGELTSIIKANSASIPAIQIGNDEALVRGCTLQNLAVDGQTSARIQSPSALYFSGGAYECSASNVRLYNGTNVLRFCGGSRRPCSVIGLTGFYVRASAVPGGAAVLAERANASYTTALLLSQGHINGTVEGFAIRLDGADLTTASVYLDCYPDHGILIDGKGGIIYGAQTTLDLASPGVLITSSFRSKNILNYLRGSFIGSGDLRLADSSIVHLSNMSTIGGPTNFMSESFLCNFYAVDEKDPFSRDNKFDVNNGQLRLTSGGEKVMIQPGVELPAGEASAPSLAFKGSPKTGFYQETLDSISFTSKGDRKAILEADGLTISGSIRIKGREMNSQDASRTNSLTTLLAVGSNESFKVDSSGTITLKDGGWKVHRVETPLDYQIKVSDFYIVSSQSSTKTLPSAKVAGMGSCITVKSLGSNTVTQIRVTSEDSIDKILRSELIGPNASRKYISDGISTWESN